MRSGAQLIGSFAVLLALQATTSLVAIALLGRMSPAFERILLENVASAEAVEEMALVLARPSFDDTARANYRAALGRASKNVTEPEEQPLLAELETHAAAALAGDPDARRRSLDGLERLGRINRRAMTNARDEAERLGVAGAWSVTFLAVLALGVSFIGAMRTRRRILAPLAEIRRVVTAHQAGERRARCTHLAAGGDEIALLCAALNDVLDHCERTYAAREAEGLDRAVLLHLLDDRAEPLVVVDAGGELIAANRTAEALLASEHGSMLRTSLRAAGPPVGRGLTGAAPIGRTGATLCVLERPGLDAGT
jgi:PAS domain-containing protein